MIALQSLLALAVDHTEDGQELKLGDGIWGPTVTLGSYKLYFADPQAGQVGFFGTTKVVTRVEERRFPVIDEERGMVLSIIRFDHSGKTRSSPGPTARSTR